MLANNTLAAVRSPAMAGGQSIGSPVDADQSLGRAWQPDRGIYDVPGRLSRSTTIALIVSPVGLLLISVIRLLIVADYNPATASAIVSSGGYVDTLLGTIIPLVPIFAPYLALLLLFFGRVIAGLLTLLAVAFMSPVLISPTAIHLAGDDWSAVIHRHWLVLIALAVLTVAFAVTLVLELMGLGFGVTVRTLSTVACIALVPFIMRLYPFPLSNEFYTGVLKQPWLPAETISLTSGEAFTGYVLSDNGTWLVALRDGTRTIHYYRSAQVASQQICQITPLPSRQPLIPLFPAHLNAPTRTPPCGAPQAGRGR
jgi:hypothetical protein